jgi:hypothetical protein
MSFIDQFYIKSAVVENKGVYRRLTINDITL